MIQSRLNPLDGWLSVWWEERDPAMPPAEAARAYESFIAEAGTAQAVVGTETPEVAEALLSLPGFSLLGREWRYEASWPSGARCADRTGFRPATVGDAPLISRILDESFGEAMGGVFPPERLARELFEPEFWNILCEADGRPAGFGSAIHEDEDGVVNFIGVVPAFRRRGIGRRIMEALLEELDAKRHARIVLTCEDHRRDAIRLYERFGFARAEGPWVNVRYVRG